MREYVKSPKPNRRVLSLPSVLLMNFGDFILKNQVSFIVG